jgi:SAM-dependent methyltransferase
MREVVPEASWPQSWIVSYTYDREEVFGTPTNWGYALAYRNRRQETLKLVTEAIEPGATVLDLAAAQGNFTLALAERGYRVTWNDLRADLAGYVQKKHERGEVAYAAGNAFELNFADGVPLCRSHHRAVHRASDEQAWWKATGIDPVEAACSGDKPGSMIREILISRVPRYARRSIASASDDMKELRSDSVAMGRADDGRTP